MPLVECIRSKSWGKKSMPSSGLYVGHRSGSPFSCIFFWEAVSSLIHSLTWQSLDSLLWTRQMFPTLWSLLSEIISLGHECWFVLPWFLSRFFGCKLGPSSALLLSNLWGEIFGKMFSRKLFCGLRPRQTSQCLSWVVLTQIGILKQMHL